MVILIKDSTNVVFENNFYDTILFDPPYMTEAEFNKKFVGEGKKEIIQTQRDLFAGWGDSVIAAQNLGLHIDAYDIDQSLAERYNYLNSLSNKKQLTLREVSS